MSEQSTRGEISRFSLIRFLGKNSTIHVDSSLADDASAVSLVLHKSKEKRLFYSRKTDSAEATGKKQLLEKLDGWRKAGWKVRFRNKPMGDDESLQVTIYNLDDIIRWCIHEDLITSLPGRVGEDIRQKFLELSAVRSKLLGDPEPERVPILLSMERDLLIWFRVSGGPKGTSKEVAAVTSIGSEFEKTISQSWSDVSITVKCDGIVDVTDNMKLPPILGQRLKTIFMHNLP